VCGGASCGGLRWSAARSVVVCGSLRWSAVVYGAVCGGLRWSMVQSVVVCGGLRCVLWWSAVRSVVVYGAVCGDLRCGLWWSAVVCGGLRWSMVRSVVVCSFQTYPANPWSTDMRHQSWHGWQYMKRCWVIQVACKMLLLMYTVMTTDAEAGNTHKTLKKISIKLSEHKLLWKYQKIAVCELNHDTALKLLHFVTSQTSITSDLQGGTKCKKNFRNVVFYNLYSYFSRNCN